MTNRVMIVETFKVTGSHGEFDVNINNGQIVNKDLSDDEYKDITRFDVNGYRLFLKNNNITDRDITIGVDILDIGYWFQQMNLEIYEPADEDHRNLVHGIDKTQQDDLEMYKERVDALLWSYYGIGTNDVDPVVVESAYGYKQSPREIVLEIGERFGLNRL